MDENTNMTETEDGIDKAENAPETETTLDTAEGAEEMQSSGESEAYMVEVKLPEDEEPEDIITR